MKKILTTLMLTTIISQGNSMEKENLTDTNIKTGEVSPKRLSSSSDEIAEEKENILGIGVYKYAPKDTDNLSLKDVISLINNGIFDYDVDQSTREDGKYFSVLKSCEENEEYSEDAIRYAYEELASYYMRTKNDSMLKKMS